MATPIVVPPSPMGLGDVFSTSVSILRRRFGRLVRIGLLQQLVTVLIGAPVFVYALLVVVPQFTFSTPVFSRGYLASSVIGSGLGALLGTVAVVISVYFQGLLVHASHQAMLGQDPSLRELRVLNRGTLRRLGPVYAAAMLAYGVVVALAVTPMLTVLPQLMSGVSTTGPWSGFMPQDLATRFLTAWGLMMVTMLVVGVGVGIVVVKFAYLNQVGTVEGRGLMTAVKRAGALTKGSFWRTAGYLIVMGLAVGMVQQVVGMIGEIGLFPVMLNADPRHPEAIFTSGAFWGMYGLMILLMLALQAVLGPFQVAFLTVMYVDQLRRLELGPVPASAPGQYGWQPSAGPPQA